MRSARPFIQQFHSMELVGPLDETAINSNELTYDAFSFVLYYKNANQFKK